MQNTKQLAETVKDLLTRVLTELVMHPEHLVVDVHPMAQSLVIYLEALAPDVPRVIGSNGIHFAQVKALAEAMGAKAGVAVDVDNVNRNPAPACGTDRFPDFVASDNWPVDKITKLLGDLGRAIFTHTDCLELDVRNGAHGVSNIDLLVDEREAPRLVGVAREACRVLFKAIGRRNSRKLFVNVVPRQVDDPQPATAAGRWAPETPRHD